MKIQRRQIIARLAFLPLASGVQSVAWAQGSALVFGVIAPRAVEQTRANWAPFVKRLGASVGQPIELKVYEKQELMVKDFVAGHIDLGWMGNAPALEVVEAGKGAVFAQMVHIKGGFGYKSVLIVPKSSPLNSLSEVLAAAKSLRFSNGEPKSTSGFLVPLYFAFQKNGINDPESIFKATEIGSHQQNLKKVAEGKADVATANDEELSFFARDFPDLAKNVKTVWESPLIPQSPLLWKSSLSAEVKRKIKSFVVGFGESSLEEKQILEKVNGLARFRPSSNLQLVPIADLEMFKARQAINNDGALSKEERTKRINEVIQRGSQIELRLKLGGF
jgi:phosphonate transport system substrate-binding protein